MKPKLIAGVLLLAGSSLFAAPRIAIGIGVGVPVAPRYYAPPLPAYIPPPAYYAPVNTYVAPVPAYIPPSPGPGYRWTAGYWYFSAGRRLWHRGYWVAPRAHFGPRWRYR